MSYVEEAFRVIASLCEELTRLKRMERDYLKLQRGLKALIAEIEEDRLVMVPKEHSASTLID